MPQPLFSWILLYGEWRAAGGGLVIFFLPNEGPGPKTKPFCSELWTVMPLEKSAQILTPLRAESCISIRCLLIRHAKTHILSDGDPALHQWLTLSDEVAIA